MRAEACLANIEATTRKLLDKGALPVTLGGDHSVPIPILRAYDSQPPLFVVQLDAHLDYVNERHGVREGHGNVMRRIHEMPHVTGIAQLGIRGPGSSGPGDFEDAIRNGSIIIGAREFRRIGYQQALSRIPAAPRYYVTIDIDSIDASLASGSGSPSFGGFTYLELVDFLRALAKKGEIVGFDLVEVAPQYDPAEITAQMAARIILDFLGAIFLERSLKT
jgi:agmatinase